MVRIRNLHFGCSRKHPLFQNLSLTLERGHIYGLLGKNGAGKSTLLKNAVADWHCGRLGHARLRPRCGYRLLPFVQADK